MKLQRKQTGKNFILSLMLGLSLFSATAAGITAYGAETSSTTADNSDSNNPKTAAIQAVADSGTDEATVRSTYGGCGLSCGTCSLRCF